MSRTIVSLAERHIVAMGGAFGYETDAARRFLRYILWRTGKAEPAVLFLGAASGDNDYGKLWFFRHTSGMSCKASLLSFFEALPSDFLPLLLQQDAIFVGGGHSESQLALWRYYGFDKALKTAWEHGVVLSGASAGGICWFDQAITHTSRRGKVIVLEGLGLVKGTASPHFDSDKQRRPEFERLLLSGEVAAGFGIDENAALHVRGDGNVRALSATHRAKCHRLRVVDGKVEQTKLPKLFLKA